MKILLVDNQTSFIEKLEALLDLHQVTKVDWRQPLSDEGFDLIVLSGGHGLSVQNHPEEFAAEKNLIINTTKPVIGICLGCQVIASAYGAKLKRLPHRVKGIHTITATKDGPMFRGLKSFDVFQSHRWAVTELSPVLRGLATSSSGYEMIQHVSRPVYGLQFHPEMMLSKTAGQMVFSNLLRQVTPKN